MANVDDAARPIITRPNVNHEDTPLLNVQNVGETPNAQDSEFTDTSPLLRLIVYFMTIHFLLAFCELTLVAPLIKLLEQSLCISYYDRHYPNRFGHHGGFPEHLCKIPAIQTSLATIRGWKSMLDTFPVLMVTVPFGKLADLYGRRKLMVICLLGLAGSYCEIFFICAFPRIFPVQLVLLSSTFLLFGGGLPSAVSLMWTMASKSIPEDRRSHAFYFIFAAFYVAELVGSFIAAVTTDISPWIPCGLSTLAIAACLLLLLVTPDSSTFDPSQASTGTETRENENAELVDNGASPPSHTVDVLRAALLQKKMLLALPIFLAGSLRFTILNVLIQYASNRFNIKISTGALFYTETAGVNIVLFLLLVPACTTVFRNRYNFRPPMIDLFMVRTCVLLLMLGSLLIGLSPAATFLPIGVFVFASGFGSRVSALSLVSRWISDDVRATLYGAIAVFENLGHAIGDPSLQQIFAATLRLRLSPFWQALPFFVAAALYCIAFLSSTFIVLDKDLQA